MMNEMQQNYHIQMVRGFPFPSTPWFTKKNLEDAMDFVPDDGDVIIASYPKTGTTWMQYIVLQIKSKGEEFPSFDDVVYKNIPFMEVTGVEAVRALAKPRCYKHHIPYDHVQKNARSKCIYIYRHPEDTVVSFYHFTKDLAPDRAPNFSSFFENFVTGNIGYGSYFRHVLSFYEHRHDENLLLVSYEKLHANTKDGILRIAKFLHEHYYQCLQEDEALLLKIIEHTSFDYMKKNLQLTHPNAVKEGTIGETRDEKKVNFFRKGVVGDGKAVLTESQHCRLREAAEDILKGTPVLEEWYPK